MRLTNWAVTTQNPYAAPELQKKCITGIVYDNPNFDDGANITTSSISTVVRNADGVIELTTFTGSVYILDGVEPAYAEAFPNAEERLLTAYTK